MHPLGHFSYTYSNVTILCIVACVTINTLWYKCPDFSLHEHYFTFCAWNKDIYVTHVHDSYIMMLYTRMLLHLRVIILRQNFQVSGFLHISTILKKQFFYITRMFQLNKTAFSVLNYWYAKKPETSQFWFRCIDSNYN